MWLQEGRAGRDQAAVPPELLEAASALGLLVLKARRGSGTYVKIGSAQSVGWMSTVATSSDAEGSRAD